jgi:hypothetical protein
MPLVESASAQVALSAKKQADIDDVAAPFLFYPDNIPALKVYLPFPAQ